MRTFADLQASTLAKATPRPRRLLGNDQGQSLLEVTVAAAMLFGIIWGTMAVFRLSSHQEKVSSTQGAIRSEEEEIRGEVMNAMKTFIDDATLGQLGSSGHTHGHGHGSHHGSSPPGCTATEADLSEYVNMDLPSGVSLRLISSTDTIASLWPAGTYPNAQVPATSPTAAAFARCTSGGMQTLTGSTPLGTSQAVVFCLAAFPTNGPSGVAHSSLLSMMPLFGYFAFYNYYTGQKVSNTVTNPPQTLTCPNYLNMVHPGGGPVPDPPPPVLSYLYYTFFWKSSEAAGNVFANYSGTMIRGITP